MGFLQSLSPDEIQRYHRVVTHAVEVRSHFDMLIWLQGDMQHYLPHEIMLTAWGNFETGDIQHNIISRMAGVRSKDSNTLAVTPLLLQLFSRWTEFKCKPFALNAGIGGFAADGAGLKSAFSDAMHSMRSAMVHGIRDERGSHDCLYVALSAKELFEEKHRNALALMLPYIDSALRQVAHLPHQTHPTPVALVETRLQQDFGLSDRESEILNWVAAGKTNSEIGMILDISAFTVKNHMQRVFKKLDVMNRTQAVSKFNALLTDA